MMFVWLALVFLIGACTGTLLNVCIERLPYEKSLLWPGARCGCCFQSLRRRDQLPLIGYWLGRWRCRVCGTRFPIRGFVVEVLTGLCFVGLFYLDVVANVRDLPLLRDQAADIAAGQVPWQAWIVFAHHALLVCFLLVASFIDLDHHEIPLPVTTTGTVVGLVGALLWAWPWPALTAPPPPPPLRLPWGGTIPARIQEPLAGLYAWPVWYPLPDWLPAGSWQLGLATGLAGVLAGTMLLRAVRFVFGIGRGIEGLGVGDADLMMMAGAFLGWQAVVIAFFVSVAPALLIGVAQWLVRGGQELAFGPSLSLGIVLTMLGWRWIAPSTVSFFFDSTLIMIMVPTGAFFILVVSFMMRLIRGSPVEDAPKK
jgi:leader peptidase (prepilin peptidase)/N-methyltransferase